ncbi:MAG: transposase [Firmicutes bacterium]|nr:transposase [Bacillota bacterium]
MQVLKEEGKKPQSKSYMWLYRLGRCGPGILLYEYQPSRSKEHLSKFCRDSMAI